MLFRFSLYGFLKNQRYFEPFLVLAFLEKGLSFFEIGLLITIRELTTVFLEVPSGAIADLSGRRGSMILSFVAYLVSFATLGFAGSMMAFIPAMMFYGVGDAFRTGTHKSMIFTWLRLQGREDERTKIYGYTRSWSKMGSAVSGLLAAAFVFLAESYNTIFYFACIPCVFSIINFLGYPKELEGSASGKKGSAREMLRHLREALSDAIRIPAQRRLVLESMGFEGNFAAMKDYLQPVLAAASIALLANLLGEITEIQRTALLVGPVYLVLYLLSAYASRQAHVVVERLGSPTAAARFLWGVTVAIFGLFLPAAFFNVHMALIVLLMSLHILQNMWRPILVSRFDAVAEESKGATVLSIESQAQRLATMVLAPVLGLAVDWSTAQAWGGPFWPLGVVGFVIASVCFVTSKRA